MTEFNLEDNVVNTNSFQLSQSVMDDVLPDDISVLILEFATSNSYTALQLALVSKSWYVLIMHAIKPTNPIVNGTTYYHERTNSIWKNLSRTKWDIEHDINVKNWHKFYQRRKTYIDNNRDRKLHLIENCEDVETNCPMEYEKLLAIWRPSMKVFTASHYECKKCNKTVYKCTTRKEVLDRKSQGHCVAFIERSLRTRVG